MALVERLTAEGYAVVDHRVVADGEESVAAALTEMCDGFAGVVVSTGGTGFTPRDLTPEGTRRVIEREAPGLAEAMRLVSPLGRLSRGIAGIRGAAVILNTPGLAEGLRRAARGGARRAPARPAAAGRIPHGPLTDPARRLGHRAPTRAAQGFAGAGDVGALRSRRPGRDPVLDGRLQGRHRRSQGQRGAHPAAPGDPGLRGRGAVRPGHHRPRLGGGDRQPRGQPRRAALLQGHDQPRAGRRGGGPGLTGREGGRPAPGPPGLHRVPAAHGPLLRRPGHRGRRPAVLRRQRGQDPRHRRLHRRHHRDRAGAAGRRAADHRHHPRQLHRGRRQRRVLRRSGQAPRHGPAHDAPERHARGPRQGAGEAQRQPGRLRAGAAAGAGA